MLDAAGLKAALEKVVESLEREVQTKREELAELERSLEGARTTLKLPASLLKSVFKPAPGKEPVSVGRPVVNTVRLVTSQDDEEISIRGAMREAIAAQASMFTNADVFTWMTQNYPGVFKPEQSASVSSVMAKFGHKGLIRQVKRGSDRGVVVVWEKVPGKWTDKGVMP